MQPHAQVHSVQALTDFRAALVVFLSKARPTLEEAGDEVLRLRAWLEHDQRRHWDHEWRKCSRQLEEARQALLSASIATLRTSNSLQQLAVHRAEETMRRVDGKRTALRKWTRDFEHQAAPLARQVDQLLHFLTADMSRALAFLDRAITTLETYAEKRPAPAAAGAVAGVESAAGTELKSSAAAAPENISPA